MPAKFDIYWYHESAFVKNAFLFHCRDDDLTPNPKARIPQGAIVAGVGGYAVAEQAVPGFDARVVKFTPNRQCEWEGLVLGCMVHPATPTGGVAKKLLRPYNNIVARLPDAAAADLARANQVPVITTADGQMLVNLEIAVFSKQGAKSPRRAKLL